MQLLWFKRDLRTTDHSALVRAVKARASMGNILPVYIYEPELWQQPDMSHRHYAFLYECLASLHNQLAQLGCPLIIKMGNATDVLQALHDKYKFTALWSHQETWNGWTYQRDMAVGKWAKIQKIIWYEPLQYGVFRRIDRMQGRDGWATHWHDIIDSQPLPMPAHTLTYINEPSDMLPTPEQFYHSQSYSTQYQDNQFQNSQHQSHQPDTFRINTDFRQFGGRDNGLATLQSFLAYRGERYTRQMSSPVTAFDSCSRLSPHLAFGTVSLREVFWACKLKKQDIDNHTQNMQGACQKKWNNAIRSFSARLRWHCHFIQKLESEPSMEYENLHPIYDGMRERDFNEDYFKAWQTGRTGYPMIDACMRALIATGWINFRMRAMLMSFASHHLWLHWRRTALHLARLFVDYEPGIHYSQAQMQSGTTGINSIRVYNPIKQGIDQDPDGVFIRSWLPELAEMPNAFIHTPWLCADDLLLGIETMNGYPMPIVDEKSARRSATDKLADIRKHREHGNIAKQIVKKHASRKGKGNRKKNNAKKSNKQDNQQISLSFE